MKKTLDAALLFFALIIVLSLVGGIFLKQNETQLKAELQCEKQGGSLIDSSGGFYCYKLKCNESRAKVNLFATVMLTNSRTVSVVVAAMASLWLMTIGKGITAAVNAQGATCFVMMVNVLAKLLMVKNR